MDELKRIDEELLGGQVAAEMAELSDSYVNAQRRTSAFSLDAWYGFTSALWLWGVYLKNEFGLHGVWCRSLF